MMTKRLRFTVRGFGNLFLMWSVLAMIWSARPAQAEEAVPWISAMEGKPDTLSIKHQDGEWFQATLNTPITKGDDLYLEAGGRAEIFLDGSSYIRLEGPASLRFDTLQAGSFDVAQNVGQALFQTGPDTEVFLVTPNLGLTIHGNSWTRLNVAEDEGTEVTTLRGQVELNGPSGYAAVNEGQSLYLGAGSDNYSLSGAPPPDDFDRWSERRDRRLAAVPPTPAPAAQYLPPPAASSLASNGRWYNDPGYGWVWQPSVSPDWSPYTIGHWGWWPGWGWTWIPSEPWGWYPYHYGNWVVGGAGWFWVPGPIVSVGWSPALVFWLDGPDYIGWAPLPFGVDIVLFQRECDRDPHYVYQYVHQNNITVVNVNNFNSVNYVNVRRGLPADYRTTARFAANSQHEFRGVHDVRKFESASGPKGWVPQNRRPPDRMTNRVAPAWEPKGGHDRGMHEGQNKGERPERVIERPLPPGRGADRTPPARHENANEPHGRGPGQAAPPGQLKERPEAPGREKGIEAPSGPGREKPERPLPPGREEKNITPPSGPGKDRTERPTPPGREEKAIPPAGETKQRPTPPGREEHGGVQPSSPGAERPTPPGRESQPSPPTHQGRVPTPGADRPAPPSHEKAPAATPPESPKSGRGQSSPPSHEKAPSAPPAKPSTPPPEHKPSNAGKKKGAFLYSPPGRERGPAGSPGFTARASRETAIPRFTPQAGWGRGNSPVVSHASRPQLSRNEVRSPSFSRPSFGGSSRPSYHASAPSRPSFSGGSSFSHRSGSGGSSPGSTGRSSGSRSSGSIGTRHKGR